MMGSAAQKKALTAYRERLARRGISRFEVLGREDDRELIRSLAKHLADGGPEASEIRDHSASHRVRTAREREGFLAALRRSPLVGAELAFERPRLEGRKVAL